MSIQMELLLSIVAKRVQVMEVENTVKYSKEGCYKGMTIFRNYSGVNAKASTSFRVFRLCLRKVIDHDRPKISEYDIGLFYTTVIIDSFLSQPSSYCFAAACWTHFGRMTFSIPIILTLQ